MIRVIGAFFAASVLSIGAMAQPNAGDLVVSELFGGNLLYLDRVTAKLSSISTGPAQSGGMSNSVMMAANNHDLVASEIGTNNFVLSITPTGLITTLATVSASTQAGDMLQNGSYVFNTFNALLELDPFMTLTTLATLPSTNAMARNHDTDSFLLGLSSTGKALLDWNPRSNAFSTLCTFPSTITGVDPMPRGWGGKPAVAFSSFSQTLGIYSGNAVVKSITGPRAQALKVDDATGNIYIVSTVGNIQEYDPNTGTSVNTWGPFGSSNFSGIESYRSRRVAGTGTGAPGSPYGITLNLGPAAAKWGLIVGLSLSQRPGIVMPGGGRINLGFDGLLVASAMGLLNGVVLSGFPATLDSSGRGSGTILIPSVIPRGTIFFVSGIVAARQSVITANTIGVYVQ